VTKRNYHDHKHLVFDCKVNSIIELFLIVQSDFFIVDKKYGWFTYFKVNMEEQTATIFRSGEILTPFETL
jgi:hypothetical protein